MALTLFLDPGPRIVRYLRRRFASHATEKLPDDLQVTAYQSLGKERPRLIVSYETSEMINPKNGLYVTNLQLTFDSEEIVRGDEGTVENDDLFQEYIDAFQDLLIQFLSDTDRMDEFGVGINAGGAFNTQIFADEADQITVLLTQPVQAFVHTVEPA